MMEPKVIKTEEEYQAALAHLDSLMDAAPGSAEEQDLELFSVLIEKYEDDHYPIGLPDPLEAIKFRMEQQGLTRKDLIPYIGSQSKVSEVLNGKRPLSLSMIRALHGGLGIPAEVLLQEPGRNLETAAYRWQDFPFTELLHRGYFIGFEGDLRNAKEYAEELLSGLFSIFSGAEMHPVYCRSTEGNINTRALAAWQALAMRIAEEQDLPAYRSEKLNPDAIRDLAKLSTYELGPRFAMESIHQMGIAFVLLDHLPNTYLDGACFKTPSGIPVIGMTLRHDRLDNFWFTLIHELVHVHRHLELDNYVFFDDTDHLNHKDCAPQEQEANDLGAELLIPEAAWIEAKNELVDSQNILAFAEKMGISPAIIAGRLRWEAGDYRIFSDLVGQNQVRRIFAS